MKKHQIESYENMILMSASGTDTDVVGTGGDDTLDATQAYQAAIGLDGNDTITGSGGNNLLFGGDGDDIFNVVSGVNVVDGGEGDDTLRLPSTNRDECSVVHRGFGIVQVFSNGQSSFIKNIEYIEFADGTVSVAELLNNAPVIVDPADGYVSVQEGDTFVVDFNATDLDGDTLTYSLVDRRDSPLFTIDPSTGVVSFTNAPDFETPLDDDLDNIYEVTIQVTDGISTVETEIWVTVTDVAENAAPEFTNVTEGLNINVDENSTAVTDADATDADGDSLMYSIAGGADSSLFTIDTTTGAVSFVNAPDFNNPLDSDGDNVYELQLAVSDGTTTVVNGVTVTVNGVTDSNSAPMFTNVSEGEVVAVAENTTFVGDTDATDADGDNLLFSISGGVDASLFSIDQHTGVLTFNSAPDFENPGDADSDNEYQLTLRVTDGLASQERNVVIRVTNVTEGGTNSAPTFINVTEGDVVSVAENTTFVGDANATDADGDTLTYSISGGADSSLFTIDSATGVVSFVTAPDFENPGDADSDNEYQLTLRVSDGQASEERNVVIRVTNVSEGGTNSAPFFTNVSEGEVVAVAENTTFVGDANGSDADGDTLTYSISGGADSSLFTIDASTGVLSFVTAPDFENPGDADNNNQYQLTLRISDGQASQERNVVVRVTDIGESGTGNSFPYFTNVSANESLAILEGTTFVGDADATDADGDTLNYSIVGGADGSLFTVNSSTGVVNFVNAPDFENPADADSDNLYEFILRVDDGQAFQQRLVSVFVDDAAEGGNNAPTFTNIDAGEFVFVAENTTLVGDANASDADGDTLTFSIVGGADASAFQINGSTGVLSFINAPDFDNPSDSDGDNSFGVIIRVSDGSSFQDRLIWVEVTDTAN